MARGRGRSGRRTDYEWSGVDATNTGVDLAVGVTALGAGSVVSAVPATLMRTRGLVAAQLDTAAIDERALIAFGMMIVQEEAFDAGSASVPGPREYSADWFWHGFMWLSSLAESAVQPQALWQRLEIDSKAMRRLKPNDAIILVAEVASAVDQAGTFDFQYGFRCLKGT